MKKFNKLSLIGLSIILIPTLIVLVCFIGYFTHTRCIHHKVQPDVEVIYDTIPVSKTVFDTVIYYEKRTIPNTIDTTTQVDSLVN